MKFEWDEDKNQLNLKKHGIDFEIAMLVYNHLQRIEIYVVEHSIPVTENITILCAICYENLFVLWERL